MTVYNHTALDEVNPIPATGTTINAPLAQLDAAIGNLTTLATAAKTTVVAAINEVHAGLDSIYNAGTGTITATRFVGDGSALTGIASGTGGVINTGSTTIGADSDANGAGEIALQTRGVTRVTIDNAGDLTMGGALQIGTSYTNLFQSTVWIAADVIDDPVVQTQALWAVHRVSGNMGGLVHDAFAVNLNVYGASNTTYLNAAEFSFWVLDTGNVIADARCITANLQADPAATGTIANAYLIRAQGCTLPVGMSITGICASIVAEEQTEGATNYSFYSPSGANSLGGSLMVGGSIIRNAAAGTARDIQWDTAGVARWIMRADSTAEAGANAGSDWALMARTDAGGALGTALAITRSNLAATFGGSLTVTLTLTVNGNTVLGDAATDTITCNGRLLVRTTASDPQDGTAGNRPAGTLKELVYYSGKLYFCTNASTPTWEKVTSS